VLEAMAAGIPVVTTSAGAEGLPVQTGEHLFLADTPHAMREALQLLLDDADLRRSVSQSARQLTAGRFSWRGSVDRLEESLRRLVA
jgi:glycosyltransferase involved in cell wall biosynthesis